MLVRFSLFKVFSWQQIVFVCIRNQQEEENIFFFKTEGDHKNKHRINKRRLGIFLLFENEAVTKVVTLPCWAQKCDLEFLLI